MVKAAASQRRSAAHRSDEQEQDDEVSVESIIEVIDLTQSPPSCHSHFSSRPAEEFPDGWLLREIPRSKRSNARKDKVYYSPELELEFKSRSEVKRFLKCLEEANGNESVAIGIFRGDTKASSSSSATATAHGKKSNNSTSAKMAGSRVLDVEYAPKSSQTNDVAADASNANNGREETNSGLDVRGSTTAISRSGARNTSVSDANRITNDRAFADRGGHTRSTEVNNPPGPGSKSDEDESDANRHTNTPDPKLARTVQSTPQTNNRTRSSGGEMNASEDGDDGQTAAPGPSLETPKLARTVQSTPQANNRARSSAGEMNASEDGDDGQTAAPGPSLETTDHTTTPNNAHPRPDSAGGETTFANLNLNVPLLLPTPSPGKMGQSLGETAENLTMILGHLTIGGTLSDHHWRGLSNIAVNLTRTARHLRSVEELSSTTKLRRTSTDTTTSSEWGNMFELKEGGWRCDRCLGESPDESLKTPRAYDGEGTFAATAPGKETDGDGTAAATASTSAGTDAQKNDGAVAMASLGADNANSTGESDVSNRAIHCHLCHSLAASDTASLQRKNADSASDELTTPPTPEPTPRTLPESGWGDFFMLRIGEWRCKTCLVVNSKGATGCLCCVALDSADDDTNDAKANELNSEILEDQLASMEVKLTVVTEERNLARQQLKENDAKINDLTLQNKELLSDANAQDEQVLSFALQQNKQELKLSAATKEIAKLQNCLQTQGAGSSSSRTDGVGNMADASAIAKDIIEDEMQLGSDPKEGMKTPQRSVASADTALKTPDCSTNAASIPPARLKTPDRNKNSVASNAIGVNAPDSNKTAASSKTDQGPQKRRPAFGNISNGNRSSALKPSSLKHGSNRSSKALLPTSSSKGRTRVKFASPASKKGSSTTYAKTPAPKKIAATNKSKLGNGSGGFKIFVDPVSDLAPKEKVPNNIEEIGHRDKGRSAEGKGTTKATKPSRKSYDRQATEIVRLKGAIKALTQ